MPSLLSLPIEIRLQIYHLLIPTHTVIHITSPRRKHICESHRSCASYSNRHALTSPNPMYPTTAHFLLLSVLNKAIRAEVLPIFYSKNTFFLLNGSIGSMHEPNIRALQHFKSTTSSSTISLIRKLVFQINLHSSTDFNIDTSIREIHEIARGITLKFSGVKSIRLEAFECLRLRTLLPHSEADQKGSRNGRAFMVQHELEKMIKVLLRGKVLEVISWRIGQDFVGKMLRDVVERTKSEVQCMEDQDVNGYGTRVEF
ncbi:hypothetical protein BGZ60DRAFT_407590 [Tricladium varicosporioides]|nr:hypothetical protein BGZ60DRAFT_407590 [Hymenoscyphus varicosporioides]